ncbi:MAG: hypothetical protein CO073_03680 [Candidatus Komeilibacteria bacterium CG_4_9_14_0_8_um_filter_36_9]|uniref:Nudix hydrolase domain-containing protein n=1 Tax=Candidatus Komeilibacteria bacterium CG_4_9_14_0_8_um_filter_36_9 TaxID=1974473 RepID=A0A2M8DQH9_9BACT|nr:MAG: hypothetical protein CO073_03680 [Candidatus Komeilibacteria bacterium CG_4_9_14_0_8_um_filter_36_9]
MPKANIIIVNESDEIIGSKERGTLALNDIYRVSALWVTNPKNEILLAQRKFNKVRNPGKWGPAVAGTVEISETYRECIVREAKEELGLENIKFTKIDKQKSTDKNKHFTQWYHTILDMKIGDFTIQESEVEQIKWFTRDELKKDIELHPENYVNAINSFI